MSWGSFFSAIWTCLLVAAYLRGFYLEKYVVVHLTMILLVLTAFFIGMTEGVGV